MKWVKKHGLLLCRVICILSFSIIIITSINRKNTLQKKYDEYKSSIMEHKKRNTQFKEEYEELKDGLQKLNEENAILDDKIQLLQDKLEEEKKIKEEAVLQVNKLKDNNNILEKRLKENRLEIRQVIVDERIPESITEFILEISDALEKNDFEEFKSFWDLSEEYGNKLTAEGWYKNYHEDGAYITRIEFYDQYGTGKGSITDDYFAINVFTGDDHYWMFVGGKKDDKWVLRFWD